MRRFLPLLLLAAATPALAAADPDANQARMEREARAERDRGADEPARPQRAEREERSSPVRMMDRPRRAERSERSERSERASAPVEVASEPVRREERRQRWSAPVVEGQEAIGERVRERRWQDRSAERGRRGGDLPSAAPSPVIGEVLATPRTVSPPVASAVQNERRIGDALRNRIATEDWRREWRRDRRYDWRRHRDRHWDRFNVGIYIDPFGWNYRRWNVGWRLPSRHLASRYWINDPWHYRLPPTYGPYRWVRYWDDALLVDLRTGRVVDVIHNFFW